MLRVDECAGEPGKPCPLRILTFPTLAWGAFDSNWRAAALGTEEVVQVWTTLPVLLGPYSGGARVFDATSAAVPEIPADRFSLVDPPQTLVYFGVGEAQALPRMGAERMQPGTYRVSLPGYRLTGERGLGAFTFGVAGPSNKRYVPAPSTVYAADRAGGLTYALFSNAIRVYDDDLAQVSAEPPVALAGGEYRDLLVGGGKAFATSTAPPYLSILSLATPAAPAIAKELALPAASGPLSRPSSYPSGGQTFLYAPRGDRMDIFDITTIDSTPKVGSVAGGGVVTGSCTCTTGRWPW